MTKSYRHHSKYSYREITMSDEVTTGELARLIERNHAETREDFQALYIRLDREMTLITGRLDQTVSVAAYEADKRGVDLRFKNVEDDVASFRASTKWAIGLACTSLLTMLGFILPLLNKG
jgi:hypothetical protein